VNSHFLGSEAEHCRSSSLRSEAEHWLRRGLPTVERAPHLLVMLPNPCGRPPRAPALHLEPPGKDSTNTDEAQCASTGPDWIRTPSRDDSGCRTTVGARERTTEPATACGDGDIPPRAPAAHLEPEEQGSSNTDGAQSAGVRRPDWITSVSAGRPGLPRTARLPDRVASHGSWTHGSCFTSCLQHACSYMVGSGK